jgi:hypothetical protein
MREGLLASADPTGVPAEFGAPAFVWLSEQGIEVRFANGLSAAAGNEPLLVVPGEGKSGLQFASAGEAIGVAWQEVSASGHGVIKLRGVAQDAGLIGEEITVGGAPADFSHHSLSISGYKLSAETSDGAAASGLNLVWVASEASDAPGLGRIMLQRFGVLQGEGGIPTGLAAVEKSAGGAFWRISHQTQAETGLNGVANDNVVWVGDEDGSGGAIGRLPTVATFDTGDVLVAWVGSEGHVHGKLYGASAGDGAPATEHVAINEALADLTPHYGRETDGQGYDARRVKVGDLGPGNFALVWLVAAGADAMLNGAVFSLRAEEAANTGAADWVYTPMPPLVLPAGFTGEFDLGAAESQSSDLVLSYEVGDSAGNVTNMTVTQKIDPAESTLIGKDVPSDQGAPDKGDPQLPLSKVAWHGSSTSELLTHEQHESFAVNLHSLAEDTATAPPPHPKPLAEATQDLIVAANSEGVVAALLLASTTDDTAIFRITIFDQTVGTAAGAGQALTIDVTDTANAEVAPAVARVAGGGVAVAWVDADTGDLYARTYSAHGQPASETDLVLAAGHKVSDLALASNSIAPWAAAASHANEFAVAWVSDADADGYGQIMLQRYLLPGDSAGDHTPVALGRDGQAGNNDAAEAFVVDAGGTLSEVIGRAPQLAGLIAGQLAMSWVENDGAQETVKGAVIERDSGRSLLAIDLFQQLDQPAVVAKGTHPFLSSAANGDILVGWLEPDGSGGFDVKAAIYKTAGQDTWSLPEKVLDLQHFAAEPKDFSVGLGGDGEPQILLTWEMDSNSGAWAQHFDLAGTDLGARFAVGEAHVEAASDTTSLPDGRIVVVYAEQDSHGNLDIQSQVVVSGDASQQSSGSGSGGGDASQSGSATEVAGTATDAAGDASQYAAAGDPAAVDTSHSGSTSGADDVVTQQASSNSASSSTSGSSSHVDSSSGSSGSSGSASNDVIFGNRGTLDTHAGLGDYGSLSSASPLANDKDITVVEDATDGVIIDVVNDQDGGLRVVQVNGADLAMGAPLRIEHGFVQLRDDGDLLFTADENFHGTVNFAYTVSTEDDQLATASVVINVTPHEDDPMPVDLALDQASEPQSTIETSGPPPEQHNDATADASSGPGSPGHSSTSDGAQHTASDDSSGQNEAAPQPATATSTGSGDGSESTPRQPLEASLAGLDDPSDTITLAPRYENSGDKVERQWLQLDYNPDSGYTASYTAEGIPEGSGHENDTFVFHAAFGNDAAAESRGQDHVIDLSKSGFPTFQALQEAGALVQVGADVEITLNAADSAHPEKILLRSVSLSTLTPHDFKFS